MTDRPLSVFEFNSCIDDTLRRTFPFVDIEGEVSRITVQASGHWYFSIKDEKASLDCVMFRFNTLQQSFVPRLGDKVVVRGTPNVYAPSGRYQLNCVAIKRAGLGSLLEIIENNKRKWMSTYFTRPKRSLPLHIKTVALITSLTGDVLHDVMRNLGEGFDVKVFPAVMQGETCPDSVSSQIYFANYLQSQGKLNADVLVVARGGGSFEDLYPFNDEKIVKALSESNIVCISAIGHDPDNPLCDYAADIRANAPTQAGSMIRNRNDQFATYIKDCHNFLDDRMHHRLETAFQKNDYDRESLTKSLLFLKNTNRNYFENDKKNLSIFLMNLLGRKKQEGESKCRLLSAYSPYGILERGYSIVQNADGKVIKSIKDVSINSVVQLKLNDGIIKAKTEEINEI